MLLLAGGEEPLHWLTLALPSTHKNTGLGLLIAYTLTEILYLHDMRHDMRREVSQVRHSGNVTQLVRIIYVPSNFRLVWDKNFN